MQNQPGSAPPVFVDRTGRRRRLTVIAGTALGLGLLASLGLILAGLFFDSTVPIPGWSETKVRPPVEAGVDAPDDPATRPGPTPRPAPARATSASPGPSQPAATRATVPTAPGPTSSNHGRGDERRNTAKPTRTAGKP
ncbi:hypothetical protein ACIBPB_04380 [Micromonospora sp. NPDC049836]|uniref:hypothetical protein n=1 Tax=Micromonospora sp. NPDC049836 TaxID=3364274 RepID=UPI0037AE14B1